MALKPRNKRFLILKHKDVSHLYVAYDEYTIDSDVESTSTGVKWGHLYLQIKKKFASKSENEKNSSGV